LPCNCDKIRTISSFQLEELDLGQNLIESISSDAFVTLKKLRVLHLDANKLASVPVASDSTWRPLSSLQHLNLGQNAIQSLPDDVFLPLQSLKVFLLESLMATLPIFEYFEHSRQKIELSKNKKLETKKEIKKNSKKRKYRKKN
jgi:Leucine-rich repeat (LRR) protein